MMTDNPSWLNHSGLNFVSSVPADEKTFEDDEQSLYYLDRQRRLWGEDGYKRLSESKILIIGLNGLGAEVAKNVIIAGVKSVKLMDDQKFSDFDTASNFLVHSSAVGKNRAWASLEKAQQLNRYVEVTTENSSVENKSDSFFANFSVIIFCAIGCSKLQMYRINRIARQHGIAFFAADVFGFTSFAFSDVGGNCYKMEVIPNWMKYDPSGYPHKRIVDKEAQVTPYQDVLSVNWNTKEGFDLLDKKLNPWLFSVYVLLGFCEKHKRKPSPIFRNQDLRELMIIRDEYVKLTRIPKEMCPNELFNDVFGEIVTTCGVAGGQLSQEVFRAIMNEHRQWKPSEVEEVVMPVPVETISMTQAEAKQSFHGNMDLITFNECKIKMRPVKRALRSLEDNDPNLSSSEQFDVMTDCLITIGNRIRRCVKAYEDENEIRKWHNDLWQFVSKFTTFANDGPRLYSLYKKVKKKRKISKSTINTEGGGEIVVE